MTALRFQTGGRHLTSPASLRGRFLQPSKRSKKTTTTKNTHPISYISQFRMIISNRRGLAQLSCPASKKFESYLPIQQQRPVFVCITPLSLEKHIHTECRVTPLPPRVVHQATLLDSHNTLLLALNYHQGRLKRYAIWYQGLHQVS